MDLFQKQKFTSHAGIPMEWKIEMDAISDKEWDCLAAMIMDYQKEPFSKVVGIPRGGVKLQNALQKYSEWEPKHPWLVVDDVYTTGTSFREFCTTKETMFAYKWVVFARQPTVKEECGVRALFTMPLIIN
jgi:orotate phosphoribosyltransferase